MENKEQELQKAIKKGKILGKEYNSKEIIDFLWKDIEKLKKLPEFMPHHKFAKETTISWIVMNIITKFEKDLIDEFEVKQKEARHSSQA